MPTRTTEVGDWVLIEESADPTEDDPTVRWYGRVEPRPGTPPALRVDLEDRARRALAVNAAWLARALNFSMNLISLASMACWRSYCAWRCCSPSARCWS